MTASRYFFILLGFCGIILAEIGLAADIEFDVSLSETYSSNIFLQTEELAQSYFVTQISPELSLIHEGNRSDVRIGYAYEALFYAGNSAFNEDYHNLDSAALVDLIADELTLSGQAIYTQVNIDPTKPLASSNIAITGNRANAFYWSIGPDWYRKLPLDSQIYANYDFGRIDYDDPESQGVDSQRFELSLASDTDVKTSITYELAYDYWLLDYETSGDIRDQQLKFTLSTEIGSNFHLIGLVGLDSDFRDQEDNSLSEERWEVGFSYSDVDINMTVALGERYFGTVFRLSASRNISDWLFTASYKEEPGTIESIFLGEQPKGTDVDDTPVPPPSGLDQPGSAARFLQKRADGMIQWLGDRSSVIWLAWWDHQDELPRSVDDPSTPTDDESLGSLISYVWQAASRTTTNLSVGWENRKSIAQIGNVQASFFEDNTWRISGEVNYELGVKTTLGSGVSFISSTGNDYDEFQASIDVTRSF